MAITQPQLIAIRRNWHAFVDDPSRWLEIRNVHRKVWKIKNVDDGGELIYCPGAKFARKRLAKPHFAPISNFADISGLRRRGRPCRSCAALINQAKLSADGDAVRAYMRDWRSRHSDEVRAYQKKYREENGFGSLRYFVQRVSALAIRDSKAGRPCTVTPEYLLGRFRACRGRCELSGIRFERPPRGHKTHPFALSVDAIEPELGHVPENVQLICWGFNIWKSTIREEEAIDCLLAFADAIRGRKELENRARN